MLLSTSTKAPIKVSFILFPGFALSSFSLAVEALSVANKLSGKQLYDYRILAAVSSPASGSIESSNNVPIQVSGTSEECIESDLVFICGYEDIVNFDDPQLFANLRRIHRRNARIAALSCGSFILAMAGLLNGKSCTLVPEYRATFCELYPDIPIQKNLYTITGNILSCAGGMTALDMLLYIVGLDQGKRFALQVSEQFLQDRIRSSEEIQTSQRYLLLRIKSPALGAAIELMESHIEAPYSIGKLAQSIGTTQRNLETVFQRHEKTTPGRYYLKLRLECARKMIEESHLPLATIANATGFSSQSHFGKCFKETYNIQPSQLRSSDS
ncbi:MAG: GlxA family transcriptional regulator [Amphritea sp.]